jgi:hypothetical protein
MEEAMHTIRGTATALVLLAALGHDAVEVSPV